MEVWPSGIGLSDQLKYQGGMPTEDSHSSTNQAQHRVTSLIKTKALQLHRYATPPR